TRAGASSNTMGSAAHTARAMRRPVATRAASRRAASTSGSSGTPRLLDDLEQLHLEDQRRPPLYLRRRPAGPVGDGRGTADPALAADLHELQRLRPARDDAVEGKRHRLLALQRAVEHGAVDELALVVHLDLVGRGGRWAGARLDGGDDQ